MKLESTLQSIMMSAVFALPFTMIFGMAGALLGFLPRTEMCADILCGLIGAEFITFISIFGYLITKD